jgi:DNA polymerase-1
MASKAIYGDCKSCTLDRERHVRGYGLDDQPDLMVIGEAPGYEEVAQGRPFVGRSGKLLREILTALHIDTSRVYYTNACCCRPPMNRAPKAVEVVACHDRLISEVESVRPSIIVALGNTALSSLLGGRTGITKRRGMYEEIELPSGNIVGIIPSLHPAGVLRDPEGFQDLADDLELAYRMTQEDSPPVVQPPYDKFIMVDSSEKFIYLLNRIAVEKQHGRLVSIDLETEGLDPRRGEILSASFTFENLDTMVIDWYNTTLRQREQMAEALRGVRAVFHNGQFDLQWLWENGMPVDIASDTMLASYCLDERKGSHGLKRLATKYFRAPDYAAVVRSTEEDGRKSSMAMSADDWSSDFRSRVMRYNGADSYYTMRLHQTLGPEMREDDVSWVHDNILIPAVRHFVRFEMDGMLVDTKYLEKLGREWLAEIMAIEVELRKFPGAEELNLRSSRQINVFLFDTLGLQTMPCDANGIVANETIAAETALVPDEEAQEFWRTQNVKSGTKARSTGTYMLYWLAQQHEFPRLMVRHRLLSKQYGAYHDGYIAIMDDQCRIRPRYRLHGTRTGRLSSTDPNIHGMPRRKAIKRIFIADKGYVLIAADYSQAEIRMVAHLAEDESLIQALSETDIHRAISKKLFSLTDAQLDAMSEEERSIKRRAAKTIAFGMIYGRSPQSIAPQLGVSLREAEGYVREFYKMMPKVKEWIGRQHALVMREKEVSTIFGRKRRFPLVIDKRHASEIMRQAVNFPVQSAVSDMTILAYMRIIERLDVLGIPVKLWPHVHDGFYFQVRASDKSRAVEITKEEMHRVPFKTVVPFTAEIQAGPNWGELKTVFEG